MAEKKAKCYAIVEYDDDCYLSLEGGYRVIMLDGMSKPEAKNAFCRYCANVLASELKNCIEHAGPGDIEFFELCSAGKFAAAAKLLPERLRDWDLDINLVEAKSLSKVSNVESNAQVILKAMEVGHVSE